jgi:hypothetical protein
MAAIEKGDPARAQRSMDEHLLYLRDVLAIVRAQYHGPHGRDVRP